MKLRVTHDTIRVRLNQSEVRTLAQRHPVRMETVFSEDSKLVSIIRLASSLNASVYFDHHSLIIEVPEAQLIAWADGEAVTIETRLRTSTPQDLTLLIEKDFHCLHRDTSDDADTFPNPKQR